MPDAELAGGKQGGFHFLHGACGTGKRVGIVRLFPLLADPVCHRIVAASFIGPGRPIGKRVVILYKQAIGDPTAKAGISGILTRTSRHRTDKRAAVDHTAAVVIAK